MITTDRVFTLLAALSAVLSVVALPLLAMNNVPFSALFVAGLGVAGSLCLAALAFLISRRIAATTASVESIKVHMATLARLVREKSEKFERAEAARLLDRKALNLADSATGQGDGRPVENPDAQADLETLGRIVADLADAISSHEARLTDHARRLDAGVAASEAASEIADAPKRSVQIANSVIGLRMTGTEPSAQSSESPPVPAQTVETAPARSATPDPVLANRIKTALQSNRLDLFMRPVVSLPQRKIRFYEATIGIEHDGMTISGAALGMLSRRIGVSRQRDIVALARLIKLARYFRSKDRDVPIFVELADVDTLSDKVFANLVEAMRAEASIAKLIMIALPQNAVISLRPVELEVLKAFREAGGKIVATGLSDLSVRPEALASAGIRYAQTTAATLIGAIEAGVAVSDVHPQDLPGLFLRRGIELFCGEVSTEQQVLDLRESALALAEGPHFGDWRLVRDDLLDAPQAPPAAAMQDNAPASAAAVPKGTQAEAEPAPPPQRVAFRSLLRRA